MECFSFINEDIKLDGMCNDYECKCIGQRRAKLETSTLNVLLDYDFKKWETSDV